MKGERGREYTCHYFGDPDDCDVYQEDGKKFYLQIIQHISGILWELSTSPMEHEVCLADLAEPAQLYMCIV